MGEGLTNKEKEIALSNAVGKKPIEHELGGSPYYTCFWAQCNENLHKWYKYCPNCGQKIDWGKDE